MEEKKSALVRLYKMKPSKRRLIQLYAALLYNANIKGYIHGTIFKGDSKKFCVPGMNCYSCPGAIGACPIGSLQSALTEANRTWPFYVLGILLLEMVILGRTMCGWLCPAGMVQELFYKIKTPKLKKSKVTRVFSYLKYVILAIMVIAIPLVSLYAEDSSYPAFCKYICPVGTAEGGIGLILSPENREMFLDNFGPLFTWKFSLLVCFIVASIFIYRVFCRFFCPLGALFGLFNKYSILGVTVDESKCNHCGKCINQCKMDVKHVGDSECIACGDCKDGCPCQAIDVKKLQRLIRGDKENKALKVFRTYGVPAIMLVVLVAVYVTVNFLL